jgi:acetylornithine/succinyldiaminopimelate/putrescine aminotransferase
LPSENLLDVPWGSFAITAGPRTAAILLEPYRNEEHPEWYFKFIKDYCRNTGSLLIIDEMVTGFRWALGGACEREGIVPDLACYGKAMGNGVPIACVVGSAKLMQHSHGVSSTFGGSLDGLRAAEETIEYYKDNKVCERMWDLGRVLLDRAEGRLMGFPVHPVPNVSDPVALTQHLATKGHLIHPSGFNIMYDHAEENVDSLAEAIRSYEE